MASRPTPDFEALIARVADSLRRHDLAFMIIGGQAVLLHGEPRLTQDIDITLKALPDRLPALLQVCDAAALEPLPEDVFDFVRRTFVVPAAARDTGIRVDFIFSSTPYEGQAIERAVPVTLAGVPVPFATAEDVIIHKLFAARPRDLEDAMGVVRRQGKDLDWDYIRLWLEQFAQRPGRETVLDALEALLREARS
jgi:hypothetical protein